MGIVEIISLFMAFITTIMKTVGVAQNPDIIEYTAEESEFISFINNVLTPESVKDVEGSGFPRLGTAQRAALPLGYDKLLPNMEREYGANFAYDKGRELLNTIILGLQLRDAINAKYKFGQNSFKYPYSKYLDDMAMMIVDIGKRRSGSPITPTAKSLILKAKMTGAKKISIAKKQNSISNRNTQPQTVQKTKKESSVFWLAALVLVILLFRKN